ncbi:MAG: RHS repeat-associated core domain-containing protein [Actinobacteria bacterium]|nr:RHS repeat-associated core domain-containing protein [Actinomycetota bacterium]
MGNILSRKDAGGSSSFYHYSALANDAGNVTSLTDSTQSVIATYNYEAFGNIISQTGTAANNYKFSTKNLDDESGLYYFGARYYDSEIGRFITKDPDGGDVTDPQSLNPYVYVRNNPVNLVDPDGKEPWFWTKNDERKVQEAALKATWDDPQVKTILIKWVAEKGASFCYSTVLKLTGKYVVRRIPSAAGPLGVVYGGYQIGMAIKDVPATGKDIKKIRNVYRRHYRRIKRKTIKEKEHRLMWELEIRAPR